MAVEYLGPASVDLFDGDGPSASRRGIRLWRCFYGGFCFCGGRCLGNDGLGRYGVGWWSRFWRG